MSKARIKYLFWPAKISNFLKKQRQWVERSLTCDEAAVNPLRTVILPV